MKNVGFCGGSSIYELGAVSDVRCFFKCVDTVSMQVTNCSLITEDLYRKYIKFKDLNESLVVMNKIKELFVSLLPQDVACIAEDLQTKKLKMK